jgi:hypothetical protein
VEIGESWFVANLGKSYRHPSSNWKLGVVACACVLATQEVEVEGLWSKASQRKSMRPYLKNKLKVKD